MNLMIFDGLNSYQFNSRLTTKGLYQWLNYSDIVVNNSVTAKNVFDANRTIGSNLFLRLVNRFILFKELKYSLIYKKIEKDFNHFFDDINNVIINGEGAIHHDRLTSLILLSLGMIAKEKGKRVVLINFTIEEMSEKYLKIINTFDAVIPREKKSYLYLKPYVDSDKLIQSYDFAWYYLYTQYKNYMLSWENSGQNKILFTKGVHLNNIEHYTKFDYLVLDEGDKKHSTKFPKSIDVESLEDSEAKDISLFLKELLKYDLLISGRHHTNIVAMFLGLPTVGLKSNTSKVSATMHDMLELYSENEIPFTDINFVDFMHEEMIEKIIINFEDLRVKLDKIVGDF